MGSSVALLVCTIGVAGLFYLNRDKSARTSFALWIPVLWVAIVGSRPVSSWLGIGPVSTASAELEGSPADRFVFQVLLVLGLFVLTSRGNRTKALLKSSVPILIYFSYCLASVIWSDFADISLKRWIKAIGDLVMVLVVLTDGEPITAVKQLLERVGFVLMPASVLLIKYFGELGRGYTPEGEPMNTGVTTNKNSLGVIALVLAIGALWQVRELLRAKGQENRNRRLFAQSVLLAFCVTVLVEAHSATSGACFILATTLILATGLRKINRRPAMVHALVLTIVLGGALTMFFGGEAAVVHALGRQTNFTGRTEIWAAVIPAVPNKLVGSGFESFWLGPSREIVWRSLSGWANVRGLNEAHNGYIEVYLNLGWVGVMLLSAILFRGYVRAVAAFRRDPATGSLALTYLAVSLIYSVTEAGFRLLDPIWISLLLGIVAAGGVDSGVIGIAKEHPLVSVQSFSKIGTGYREHQYC